MNQDSLGVDLDPDIIIEEYGSSDSCVPPPSSSLPRNKGTQSIDDDSDDIVILEQDNSPGSSPRIRTESLVCAVCDDFTSIDHYGARVCGACARFFKDHSAKRHISQCRENCVINVETRYDCHFCRLQKCLAVGMRMDQKFTSQVDYSSHSPSASSDVQSNNNTSLGPNRLAGEFDQRCAVCGNKSLGFYAGMFGCVICNSRKHKTASTIVKNPETDVLRADAHPMKIYAGHDHRKRETPSTFMRDPETGKLRTRPMKDFRGHVISSKSAYSNCDVCGEQYFGAKASIGANACSRCRRFFNKYANPEHNPSQELICILGGNCEINPKTRAICRACRLKKCFEVGWTATSQPSPQTKPAEPMSATQSNHKNYNQGLNNPVDKTERRCIVCGSADVDAHQAVPACFICKSILRNVFSTSPVKNYSDQVRSSNADLSCDVCGEQYVGKKNKVGANACSSCKQFFNKYTIPERNPPQELLCILGGNCEINPRTRAGCRACRLRKCFEAGLTSNQMPPPCQTNPAEPMSESPLFSPPISPLEAEIDVCVVCGNTADGIHYRVMSCRPCANFFNRFRQCHESFQTRLKCVIGNRCVASSCPFCRLTKCMAVGMQIPAEAGCPNPDSEPSATSLEDIIRYHKVTSILTTDKIQEVLDKPLEFVNVSSSDALEAWQFFAPQMDVEIRQILKFLHSINSLAVDISMFKIYMLRVSRALTSEGLFLHDGRFLDYPILTVLFGEKFAADMLQISNSIKSLNLTEDDLALLTFLMILESGTVSDEKLVKKILESLEANVINFGTLMELTLKLDEINDNFQKYVIPWLCDNNQDLQLSQTFADVFGIPMGDLQEP